MAAKEEGFGAKSISFIGSLCLLCNNICSAGMVQIPGTFQTAGWLYPLFIFVISSILSCFSSLYLCKALSWTPGNVHFTRRLEFSGLAQALFPKWLYLLTVVVLIFCFMANIISAIVVSAQVMDSTLLAIFHKTCGMIVKNGFSSLTNTTMGTFDCISDFQDASGSFSPFGNAYVVSLGYIIVMCVVIPLGYLNLDDNVWVQVGGVAFLSACVFVWVSQFISDGLNEGTMPTVNTSGFPSVLATVLFNYGYVPTVPSWLNEKGARVPVVSANIIAVIFSTFLYLLLGFFGALGLSPASAGDVLSAIESSSTAWTVSKVATYIFPIANLMSSIPVFSILIRYNLLNSGICKKHAANVFAVLLPWILALFFYAGDQLALLINWSAAIFFVALNFIIPIYMYIVQYHRVGRYARSRHSIDETDTALLTLTDQDDLMEYTDESVPFHEDDHLLSRPRDKLYVLPEWVRNNVISEISLAYILVYFSAAVALAAFIEQIQTA